MTIPNHRRLYIILIVVYFYLHFINEFIVNAKMAVNTQTVRRMLYK